MDTSSVMKIFADTAYVRMGGSAEELRCAQYLQEKALQSLRRKKKTLSATESAVLRRCESFLNRRSEHADRSDQRYAR